MKHSKIPLLTSHNYSSWAILIEEHLEKKRIGYTLGLEGPAKDDPKECELDEIQAAAIIRSHISPEIKHEFAREKDPVVLWVNLKEKFGEKRLDLHYLHAAFMKWSYPITGSLKDHIYKINDFITQLTECGNAPHNSTKLHVLLDTLPSKYVIDKRIIMNSPDITYERACDQLLKADVSFTNQPSLSPDQPPVASYVQHGREDRQYPVRKVCFNCGGCGHIAIHCSSLRQGGRQGFSRGRGRGRGVRGRGRFDEKQQNRLMQQNHRNQRGQLQSRSRPSNRPGGITRPQAQFLPYQPAANVAAITDVSGVFSAL